MNIKINNCMNNSECYCNKNEGLCNKYCLCLCKAKRLGCSCKG